MDREQIDFMFTYRGKFDIYDIVELLKKLLNRTTTEGLDHVAGHTDEYDYHLTTDGEQDECEINGGAQVPQSNNVQPNNDLRVHGMVDEVVRDTGPTDTADKTDGSGISF